MRGDREARRRGIGARRARGAASVRLLALVGIAAALGLVRCGDARPSAASSARPSVLVVVVDALRADRLGCYGYERGTSPQIDAFAADPDAVLFRRHYVQGAATKTSTASLFTGLFAFQHGVTWGHEMKADPARAGTYATQILDERFETVAERLRATGYHTFGVVKSHHLVEEYGFAQGFDAYVSPRDVTGDAKRVRRVIELAREAPGPFFGYVHLAGVHHPFPEDERHAGFMEEHGFEYDEKARAAAGVDFTTSEMKHAVNEDGVVLDEADTRYLNLVYDAKLRAVDEDFVGPLLRGLEKAGVYDNTLIVLTADHGEELYDHGGYAHGHALWDEVIRVPLIVKFPRGHRPGSLGVEVEAVTQAIDLLPSLVGFAGAPTPPGLPGTDIFRGPARGSAYSETRQGWMLVQERHKLIVHSGETFLSDLEADPGETVNLASTVPARAEAMRFAAEALREHVTIRPVDAPVRDTEPDEEALEALRALGYLR